MRLRVTLEVVSIKQPLTQPDKHTMQLFWYDLLEGTEHESIKSRSGYKFFCYSDVFPISSLVEGGQVNVILSSPWDQLVSNFHNRMTVGTEHQLSEWGIVRVLEKKMFKLKNVGSAWITGSPIVVRASRDGRRSSYLALDNADPENSRVFIQRLTDNARKKFRAFFGMPVPRLQDPLFVELQHGKTVRIPVKFDEEDHIVVGTKWRVLKLPPLKSRVLREFYQFLMEVGLGERNSLGFGFVNPIT